MPIINKFYTPPRLQSSLAKEEEETSSFIPDLIIFVLFFFMVFRAIHTDIFDFFEYHRKIASRGIFYGEEQCRHVAIFWS